MAKKENLFEITSDFINSAALKLSDLSAQAVAFRLVGACMENRFSVFRIGGKPLSYADVAVLSSLRETDLEANIPQLVENGLLTVEPDGAICFPAFAARMARSEINRINGLKGGRPKAEKQNAEIASPAKLIANTKHKCLVANSWKIGETDYEDLMRQVLEATGLDREESYADRTLRGWLRRGFTPDLIMAVLTAKVPSSKIDKLAWWRAALMEVANAK